MKGLRLWLTCCALLASSCGHANHESSADSEPLLAPALRRLSNAELDTAAQRILGVSPGLSRVLPPDARQSDYSRNVAQLVDPLLLSQLYDATLAASAALDLSLPPFPTCAPTAASSDRACAESTARALSRSAFRREPSKTELSDLLTIFDVGAEGADFRSGAALLVRALLGSPKLLYATSFGQDSGSSRALSDDELATELSFLVSGAPPDAELVAAAGRGELSDGKRREREALRLLGQDDARILFRRFITEWLGIVHLDGLAKSAQLVADFGSLREAMQSETDQFVDDVFAGQAGSIAALLAGGYSLVPDALANFYGIEAVPSGTRVALGGVGRLGILQQASFLATYAHESESAPVLRGKAVLTRLLCVDLDKPSELGSEIVFPAADPQATTRERFARHAADPLCNGCHALLDGIGFSFENFDAVGRLRDHEADRPIDSSGSIILDARDTTLEDSAALARALAASEQVRNCAARQVVRFAAGLRDDAVERAFVASLAHVSVERRSTFLGLFLEFVKSDWFAWRKAQ